MVRVTVEIDHEAYERLAEVARAEMRPVSWQAAVILRKGLGLAFPYPAGAAPDLPSTEAVEELEFLMLMPQPAPDKPVITESDIRAGDLPPIMTLEHVRLYLGFGRGKTYEMARMNLIPGCIRSGRSIRVIRDTFLAGLADLENHR